MFIRVDRIEPVVLKFVCAQFVNQTNTAAFLREIQKHAAAGLFYRCNCAAQLVTAIATQAPEQVTGKTLRVQSGQHWRVFIRIANHDGDMGFAAIRGTKGDHSGLLCAFQRHYRVYSVVHKGARGAAIFWYVGNVES